MVTAISWTVTQDCVTSRTHGQLMNRLNREALERHATRNLPRHFEGGATARYGYRVRSAKYNAWKGRRVGHTIPLVLTGQTKEHVLANVQITATRNRGRLRSRGRTFGKGLGGLSAEMRSEIERVMPSEKAELAQWFANEYTRLCTTAEYRRKRRRRGGG
jgi:hypothetical protein